MSPLGHFYLLSRNFGPRSVWTLPKSCPPPPHFGHGEFKNQGFVAQQNGGGAIQGAQHGRFSENLLLRAWHTYRVFTVLGPVLKHIVTMANFSDLVNDAKFHAESTGANPTLQLNDIVERITKNYWQCNLQKSS